MTWAKLKSRFEEEGKMRCELCNSSTFLTPMHRLKRRFYTKETLWDYNEIVIACRACHEELEYDREETQKVFDRLRPNNLGTSSRYIRT